MGQQQLLLVILVTIVVGIATVVALNTFGATLDRSAQSAVRVDLISISEFAQVYYMRAELLGGGGRTFNGIDFTKIAFAGTIDENDNRLAVNENGTYQITEVTAVDFIVEAIVNDSDKSMIAIRVCQESAGLGDIGIGTAPEPPACNL